MRRCFDRSWALIEQDPTKGLRIKIRLDPVDPRVLPLTRFPWELLHGGQEVGFLALDCRTPIVRYLDVPGSLERGPRPRPFRILVVASQPRGVAELDLGREARSLEAAVPKDCVAVETLGNSNVRSLRRKLRESMDRGRPFHALHFMGHGGVDRGEGKGFLLFEDESGDPVKVTGCEFAALLRGFRSLRFVFLNACETGRSPSSPEPFSGVADALVLAGVPAVVAMRFPVLDQDAIAVAATFYERLAKGDPVDTAITEARVALFDGDAQSPAWAIPILFMRTFDGRLFALDTLSSSAEGAGSWTLADLSDRSEFPPILTSSERNGERCVLTAHVGPSLVVGRCHAFQLQPRATQRLRQIGEERVHWVLAWNDASLPQLIARLAWRMDEGSGVLLLENLTDYSLRALPLVPGSDALEASAVAPGEARRVPAPVAGGGDRSISTGLPDGREVLRLAAVDGPDSIPVLRTHGVTFSVPAGESEVICVRLLGLWFPMTMRDLVARLAELPEALVIPLTDDLPGASIRIALRQEQAVAHLDAAGAEIVRANPCSSWRSSARTIEVSAT